MPVMGNGGREGRPTRRWAALIGAGLLLVAAGCGGSGGGVSFGGPSGSATSPVAARPSWAGGLGAGVTVTAPQKHPAAGSPGAVALAALGYLGRGDLSGLCGLVEPSVQDECKQSVAGDSGESSTAHGTDLALGYVAVAGDEALVGYTGTVCDDTETPPCGTNDDPAALFDGGGAFDALYSQAVDAGNSDSSAYSLLPCVRESGKWYLFIPSSGG